MPFCTKCGTQYQEGQTFCGNCGLNLNTNQVKNESISFDNTEAPSKKEASIQGYGLGFVLSFFVGIAGLIIALILGDDNCKRAAIITFVCSIVLSVIVFIIYFIFMLSALQYM